MLKQAPSAGRLFAMVCFTLSVLAILLFLWLTFGGSIPLRPEGYRFEVAVPEASTLALEADVRLAGVSVGRVKSKELEEGGERTLLEVELRDEFAPIERDARLILRQKTLLGEAYLELAPGHESAGMLPDGARLPDARAEPTVELDEIFSAFDDRTQRFFRRWVRELAKAVRGRRGQDLNDALGSLAGVTADGDRLFRILDNRRRELRSLVKNGGVVLGAINERRGALRGLVSNANSALEATASRDEALAETVRVLPTFLDEARTTLTRLERFSGNARPLVRELRLSAGDLAPTLRDVRRLSPDLEGAFRDLGPLTRASRRGLPALERTVRGAGPVVDSLNPFLDELNPILAMLGYYQVRVAGFLSNGGVGLNGIYSGERALPNTVLFDPRSFESYTTRPEWDRGNAYLQPNVFNRLIAIGSYESTDCSNATPVGARNRFGDVKANDAVDVQTPPAKAMARRPPCVVAGRSLYDNRFFSIAERAKAPVKPPPRGLEGELPTADRP